MLIAVQSQLIFWFGMFLLIFLVFWFIFFALLAPTLVVEQAKPGEATGPRMVALLHPDHHDVAYVLDSASNW